MRRSARFFAIAVVVLGASAPCAAIAATPAEQRAALESQLAHIENEITQNQVQLVEEQKQRTSLERDVAILNSKIEAAQLGIKQRDLTIKKIQNDIGQKEAGIESLDSKVADGQQSLAQIVRKVREIDDTSLVETALAGSLPELFQDLDDFQIVERSLGESFTQMATLRSDLSARKQALEDQQQEEEDLRKLQVLQQQSLKNTEQQKQDLVTAAKGQETIYQQMIAQKQQSAAQIRAALFDLRDTKAVSFGDIYSFAKEASLKTGVRAAVILGILAEESNLGQNVGTGSWRVDMNQTRDAPVFQQICAELGLNPDSMPVSKRPSYGWGGAMGPAQFIPSTWQLYRDRIAAATGENPPNPWNARTATFATAILMMDNGADQQTPQAERLAALRYLAGWKNATKAAYAFYGDDVMDLAAKFQSQIDILGG